MEAEEAREIVQLLVLTALPEDESSIPNTQIAINNPL